MSGPDSRKGHASRASLDTNASGLGSAMSFSGFSHRFPAPPSSLPSTPSTSTFSAVSPLVPRRTPTGNHSPVSAVSDLRPRRDDSLRNISPYDWHEGAKNPDPTGLRSHRTSVASDFSEMTYPPVRGQFPARTAPLQRPQGARPPPSSFQPIPEASVLASDDDTLYSNPDPARAAGPAAGPRVVGVASGTLRNMKVVSSAPSYGVKEDLDMDNNPYDVHASFPYSAALPSTAGTQRRFLPAASPEARQSVHSTKSFVPSFVSASSRSIRKMMTWRRKPLPPVPRISHIPVAEEAAFKKKEEATSLSELLLSFTSKKPAPLTSKFEDGSFLAAHNFHTPPVPDAWRHGPSSPQIKAEGMMRKKKNKTRIWIILVVFLAVALAAVGAAVGVTVHNRNTKGKSVPCSGNLVGVSCNLDATCTCTSPFANRCDGLAQNLVSLTPTMNRLFNTNFTTNEVYTWIWTTQGTTTGKNCASQATLVDVGVTLSLQNFPNRTQWVQAALLWDLQSLNTSTLQQFVIDAPWSILTVDGPASVSNTTLFSTGASGYQFDFAAQTILPPALSFATDGSPTPDQAAEVTSTAPLDRMYTASTQYQGLLQSYWTTNLQRTPDKLPIFMSLLSSAPIVVPFDVENNSQINVLESVFGLPQQESAKEFSTSCFPSRPVYGVLDILRPKVARQSVTLKSDVRPRAVIYSGEVLSAFPAASNISSQDTVTDVRLYGTLNHFNHVVLRYLRSMPITVASAVVDFVLSNSTSPPTSSVFSSATIPSLEVAIFGTITKSDLSFATSAFADAAGELVFGSTAGDALRQWAIPATSNLVWTEFANSSLVVHDTSFKDATFTTTWEAAAGHLKSGDIGVFNITNSFSLSQKFSP
ncbi:hypothetical protein C8J57DRAFT_1269665 [Mycena rebaudengoi]|nr:hypothetical protein C8J57DRAFT_1269665 [Mycena rebaudengoi]